MDEGAPNYRTWRRERLEAEVRRLRAANEALLREAQTANVVKNAELGRLRDENTSLRRQVGVASAKGRPLYDALGMYASPENWGGPGLGARWVGPGTEDAAARGWEREAERHRCTATRIEQYLAALHEPLDGPVAAD